DLPARHLRAGCGGGHPPGAYLEVDSGGPDTDQRRAEHPAVLAGQPLAAQAVAGRTTDGIQLPAFFDKRGLIGLDVGTAGGGEDGVEASREEECHETAGSGAQRMPPTGGNRGHSTPRHWITPMVRNRPI